MTKEEQKILKGIYRGMKNRCYNPNEAGYSRYGAAGVRICDRWLGELGFTNFCNDMGARPPGEPYMIHIDRIDTTKDYSPENCRWITVTENMTNRRMFKKNVAGYKGVSPYKNGGFRAIIAKDSQDIVIGNWFKTAEDAAISYDCVARLVHKQFAVLNYPNLTEAELKTRIQQILSHKTHPRPSKGQTIIIQWLNLA